jgi:phospholipid N-methyltransferase
MTGFESEIFDPDYFIGRELEGLAPTVADSRSSGIRAILKHVSLPAAAHILEIGGGQGRYTTPQLLDLFDQPIDIVEIDKERAAALQAKFDSDPNSRGRVQLHHADARDFKASHRYELIVVDLPTSSIGLEYEEILPRLDDLITEQGKVILYTVYDVAAVYDVPNPPRDREGQERFMLSYFGTTNLTLAAVQRALWPRGYACLGLVDRWMLRTGPSGYGLVYVEKRARDT